jgi:hypothetical protein
MPPMQKRSLTTLVLFLTLSISALAASPTGTYQVFVGTYTGPHSKGIYTFQFDPATGNIASSTR